ncbi:MAG: nickel-responsive transcriptional regulator NikR [Armatimonadetes bacterium CG_4_10_14_3_um_filter_66_18]|nr:nickel-responsive transcriptional regulator NikR [Armatimonadota bacterium]OIO95719.1 MAG: nickel-responsive regulator [Armatimonadetes bacterium CG2_30_66_41]PIU90482.1 MAG: nickel-responsive transcriptional regulator NikR [Armatimonadetes bacterium CG06_land_8_20_14_3_00_66_21]PIX42524.1 MAG: nickel-responsive transcriptional regulator NikR [Armatimonadetes bacterium CG_4_8_14_3_um_filter_66_20]PIY37535.1 MAG: nickel-responsive transcriptional regulator NikR [Armatimonadetes bacterium CG_4
MSLVERFGVSMSPELLKAFDARIRQKGYANRSEAIRDIVRNYLVEAQWQEEKQTVVGTVTLVYDHHTRELDSVLTEMQHEYHDAIQCATHVHLDHHNCLEVIVVRGTSKQVREIGDRLISARGVKHGKIVCTTTGEGIP